MTEDERKAKERARQARWRERNRDKVNAKTARWRARNPEYQKQADLKRYRENSESERARRIAYYQRTYALKREGINAKRKEDRRINPEKYKTEYLRNADSRRATSAKVRANNPEKVRLYNKKYRAENAELVRELNHQRRAREVGATIGDEREIKAWVRAIRKKASVKCYWCQKHTPGGKAQQDHIIPLVSGGSHSLSNLCISCPRCNRVKSAKPLARWNRELLQPVLL